jgi:hypothetical protein
MSWIWDVPFERLQGRIVVSAGERAADLSVRLRYAEVEHVYEPSVTAALGLLDPGPVTVLANYSAFQGTRRALRDGR